MEAMHVYFMGICGTAMGNAALLMKAQGHSVSGSDSGVYPPMSTVLESAGIEIFEGFDGERLAKLAPDLVVVGNAMSRGNPEVEWVLDSGEQAFLSLPQLFHDQILSDRLPIVVAGTHGKTTTASIVTYLLENAGAHPGWLIGGLPRNLSGGSNLGTGAPFVIEGDEYDSAFFDKRSKFIHYRPHIAILNNLEFDHADIFRDLEDVKRSFAYFLRVVPKSGKVLLNGDDANLENLLPIDWTEVVSVGTDAHNQLRIINFKDAVEGSSFELHWQGDRWATVSWELHGLYNARNAAMGALAAAFAMGFEDPKAFQLDSLKSFKGVQRRQDVLWETAELSVLEDFAHHPTAIAGALEGLRAAYPKHQIHACFEPRSHTATQSLFQADFTQALSGADRVSLGVVHRAERIAVEERLDVEAIAEELEAGGVSARSYCANLDLLQDLKMDLKASEIPTLVVFFTNGAFDGIQHALVESISECGA